MVKEAIAKDVPAIVMQATTNSERRIQSLYDEMLDDSNKKKQAWLETQTAAIESANSSQVQSQLDSIAASKTQLVEIINKI